MALENLIRQVQIAVRTNAGLSAYDPNDPSLPPLPLLNIVPKPSSPSDQICGKCNAKLLRGRESLLCIYCGEKHENDEDDSIHPFSFNSTFACQWLLHSLDLHHEETVGPSNEEVKIKRAESTPKKEVYLHDLLNLAITRPKESDTPKANVMCKTLEHCSTSLNLTGDLNNVFSGSKRFIAFCASEESVVATEIESNEPSLFPRVMSHAAGSASRSFEDYSYDSYTGIVGLSFDMDSECDQGKNKKSGELKDYSECASSSYKVDLIQDDPSHKDEHFASGGEDEDNPTPHNLKSPTYEGGD